MPTRNATFSDPRVASEVLEVEGLGVGEVLLAAVDRAVVPEPETVLVEPEDTVDMAVELTDVLAIEDDSVAVPPEVPLLPEWE